MKRENLVNRIERLVLEAKKGNKKLDEKQATEIANAIISFSLSGYSFVIFKGILYDEENKNYSLNKFGVVKKGKYWSKEEIEKIKEKYYEIKNKEREEELSLRIFYSMW